MYVLNFSHVDEDNFEAMEKAKQDNEITGVLFEDLPQFMLQTLNSVSVGYTLSWIETFSMFTSLTSAIIGISTYTLVVARKENKLIPTI
jgi:hypothetical protein